MAINLVPQKTKIKIFGVSYGLQNMEDEINKFLENDNISYRDIKILETYVILIYNVFEKTEENNG